MGFSTHWWVTDLYEQDKVLLIAQVFWVIFSICLHELGHGWMAIRLGDDTPLETGHMTLNPLVHMPPVSLILFAVCGITWGRMPVDPSRLRGRHADAAVAIAGPAVNLGLAIVSFAAAVGTALWYWHSPVEALQNLWKFFTVGSAMNVVLLLLNLVPAPPLDGSRVLASFVAPYRSLIRNPQAAMVSIVLMLLLFRSLPTGRLYKAVVSGTLDAAQYVHDPRSVSVGNGVSP